MTPNRAAIIEVLADIELHPETHDQGTYATAYTADAPSGCGSAHCIAGRAVVQAGIPLRWEPGDDVPWVAKFTADGRDIAGAANDVLGINASAWTLYHPLNTLDEIYCELALWLGVTPDELRAAVQERISDVNPATLTRS